MFRPLGSKGRVAYTIAVACVLLGPQVAANLALGVTRAVAAHAGISPDPKKQIATYRGKLAKYTKAHDAFEKLAVPYWKLISEKRTLRHAKRANNQQVTIKDYVLEQPPAYTGPPKPQKPGAERELAEVVPVVADFLKHAKEQFGFAPQAPTSETEYKRAYAKAATIAGLTKEECIKIYGFEAGGNGKYDVQAGLEYDTPSARAISTALGYNQLLVTNSVELLAENGDEFALTLSKLAEGSTGARQTQLHEKIVALRKMIAFTRSVSDGWAQHSKLANTTKGLGVHALNLDIDVGPLLQTRKLLTSVGFAKTKGYATPLTAAELEMMNLTGDGNGIEMVLMPSDLRDKVPTSNFFQRGGYERNGVAIVNNTVGKLLAATGAKMESEGKLQGARDLAAAFDAPQ